MSKNTDTETIDFQSSRVPSFLASILYVKCIVFDLLHKAIYRRVRTRNQVESDYGEGVWRHVLESKDWEKYNNLDDYLHNRGGGNRVCQIENSLLKIPSHEYYRYRSKKITEIIDQFAVGEKIIEIGSGSGDNLFILSLVKRWSEIRGLELSNTGRDITCTLIKKFNVDSVSVGEIDLLNIRSKGYSEITDQVVFTYFCLEQLPNHSEFIIRSLLEAGVKRVIHIEPTSELLSRSSLRDLTTLTYIWRQNYLSNLIKVAQNLEAIGLIKIIQIKKLDYAPSPRNLPTLLVWEPNQS